jgi:hypothetical protein
LLLQLSNGHLHVFHLHPLLVARILPIRKKNLCQLAPLNGITDIALSRLM